MEKTMMDYIRETPQVLMAIIDHSEEYCRDLVRFYEEHGCDGLCLVASGSSYNGCLCAKPFMQHVLNIRSIHFPAARDRSCRQRDAHRRIPVRLFDQHPECLCGSETERLSHCFPDRKGRLRCSRCLRSAGQLAGRRRKNRIRHQGRFLAGLFSDDVCFGAVHLKPPFVYQQYESLRMRRLQMPFRQDDSRHIPEASGWYS